MKTKLKCFAVIVILFTAVTAAAFASEPDPRDYSRGFFWVIEGLENTVYLLGSVHIATEEIYPFSAAIEDGFANSRNLAVEVNVAYADDEAIASLAARMLIDPESNRVLADYLSAELYALVADAFEALGIRGDFYDNVYPWVVFLLLPMYMAMDFEALEEEILFGMDMHFLIRAMEEEKNIIELESFDSQMDALASLSLELIEYLLLEALTPEDGSVTFEEQMEAARAEFMFLLETVRNGDDQALIEMYGLSGEEELNPLIAEFNDKLIRGRDLLMAEKIDGFLQGEYNGNYFVIVGAAHMLGEGGIVDLLERMGYEVTRR
jgi:hypothetical protein